MKSKIPGVITPFTFEVGHNIPESKGGTLSICSRCNKSMGDSYTIDEFSKISKRTSHLWECFRFSASSPESLSGKT